MQVTAQWLDAITHHWQQWDKQRPWVMTVCNCGLLVALFILLNWLILGRLASMPEASYYQDSIAIALLQFVAQDHLLWLPLSAAVVLVALRHRQFFAGWQTAGFPQSARLFVLLVASLMAWSFATYDYNLFFDREHRLDRVLLLLALPCIYWRPIFLIPFVCLLSAVIAQFDVPIGDYSRAQQFMLIRLLVLTVATLTLSCCIRRCWFTDFLLVALCLIATHYWLPGLGKFRLGWHQVNEIYLLLPNTFANGWLGFLAPEEIARLTTIAAALNPALRAITLLLEWGVLIFLWRRRGAQFFLGCWVLFHLGIFAISGIFFWKWILVDFACIIWLQYLPKTQLANLFNAPRFCISIVLIASAAYWSKPTNLAWLEMPTTYTYRFTAVTDDGSHWTLPPKFFAPYDYQFTLGNFGYLSRQATLPIVWGGTANTEAHRLVRAATTSEQVLAIESSHGAVRYNPARVAVFDRFLRQYASAYNRRGSKDTAFSKLAAPRQLWTFPLSSTLPENAVITSIRVQQIVSWFHGKSYAEIATRLVREVAIHE